VLPVQTSNPATVAGTYRLDQPRLGRRQQLREHNEVRSAGGADPQRCVHVDADDMAARRKPQLALAGEKHVPGLMLLSADQGVLVVGATVSVGSKVASGTGEAVVAAGLAVFGPSAGLKIPAAEGPDPFLRRSAGSVGA
jgi:hypothetical protein